jgi:salicylate hydroxylase
VVEKDTPNPEALETWRSVSGTAPQIAEALEDFAGWDPTITRMIQASQGLSQWALFDRPPSTQWIRGRMALVGDAAHPMLPTFAQGASQGLEDAWTVATLVDRAGHVEDGLRRYASLRQPRTRAIQQRAMQNARDFHHQPGLEQIRAYSTLFFGGRFLPWLARGRLDEIYRYDAVAEAESAAKV